MRDPSVPCYMHTYMRNDNQILHGYQTIWEENSYRVGPGTLMRDLLVVANLRRDAKGIPRTEIARSH